MGHYAATSALLTAFDMQLPGGQKPLLLRYRATTVREWSDGRFVTVQGQLARPFGRASASA